MILRSPSAAVTDTCNGELDASLLISKYFATKSTRDQPDEVRIDPYGVSVWAIIAHLSGIDGNVEQAARDYEVPVEVICAALAYYDRHREPTDARIALHDAFFRA